MEKGKLLKAAKIAFSILIFIGIFILLLRFYSEQNDWKTFFSPIASNIANPNNVPGFVNPPWTSILLIYGVLPLKYSNAINILINVTVLLFAIKKVNGGWIGILLTFTSPLFLDMARVNPIDWIPLLGFILPPAWGFPLMAIKPQTLGASMLVKWKMKKFKFSILIPLIIITISSFLVWGNWFSHDAFTLINKPWNFSFWPLGIPIGLYLFYRAYKNEDEILAGVSTYFLIPYVAPYSMVCLLAIMSGRYKKYAFVLYVASYWFLIVESRRMGLFLPTL